MFVLSNPNNDNHLNLLLLIYPVKKLFNLHPSLNYDDRKTEISFYDATPWQKAL